MDTDEILDQFSYELKTLCQKHTHHISPPRLCEELIMFALGVAFDQAPTIKQAQNLYTGCWENACNHMRSCHKDEWDEKTQDNTEK